MNQGFIESIFTAPSRGAPSIPRSRVELIAGQGIIGDRYFGRQDAPGQNITLIEAEELEAFFHDLQRPVDYALSGRNLLTRGVRLNTLVGREFLVAGVRLLGVELCEPCQHLTSVLDSALQTKSSAITRLSHRAGLRADILSDGVVCDGDLLVVPGEVEPSVARNGL